MVAINLFRLIGRDDLLLSAFYDACQLSTSTILRGVLRADGTPEKLSQRDRELAISLKGELSRRTISLFLVAFNASPDEDECARPQSCKEIMLGAQTWFCEKGVYSVDADPLSRDIEDGLSGMRGFLCDACAESMFDRVRQAQCSVMSMLPKSLGIV